jgi:hypothetical protein
MNKGRQMKAKTLIFSCILVLLSCLYGEAFSREIPFSPGEKMTFRVRWAFVTAGEATLEFMPYEKYEGIDSCRFVFTARTTEFVDMFYKVRDRIESYTDRDITKSFFYHKHHDGKSLKEATVRFDWNENLARYSDLNGIREPLEITPGTFDPLSVFYAFRLYLKEDNSDSDIYVSDGKKHITGRAEVIRREKIRVDEKEYDTLLVEPEMENIGGVFEKSGNAKLKIWVTNDDLRLPVMIKSKVAVGSFVAELVSYESGIESADTEE